jgi:hypothetical protein
MNDDEYGTILLEPLRGEPGGASAVDVPQAMRDGRRLRQRRWWAGGSGLLAALVAALVGGGLLLAPGDNDTPKPKLILPPDPPVPAACTLTNLPQAGYRSVEVDGTDSTGRWQVGLVDPVAGGTRSPALVWHDGKVVEKVPNPIKELTLHDINSSGVAVGYQDGGTPYPYALRNGEFVRLKGGAGKAVRINDDGTIVGSLGTNQTAVPVRWRSVDAEPERLTVPAGAGLPLAVTDLSEDGTILGTSGYGQEAVLWLADGTVRKVGTPPAGADGHFVATGMRYGWLYGEFLVLKIINGNIEGVDATSPLAATYRYEPYSETWQRVAAAGAAEGMPGMTDAPKILIGPKTITLPTNQESVLGGLRGFSVQRVTEDGRTVIGNALSNRSDPTVPFAPLIWRCE